ncbi:Hypothetical_protein [Hexamita inflata]|uniref:Hypothetical_protein n=1 Tax=Hexamita inflata TaxID=28002 RepID=A0AA86NL99_9EUKA|nr:Hypothetical protein HINF_LOCUS8840 [Hexamita inflata]
MINKSKSSIPQVLSKLNLLPQSFLKRQASYITLNDIDCILKDENSCEDSCLSDQFEELNELTLLQIKIRSTMAYCDNYLEEVKYLGKQYKEADINISRLWRNMQKLIQIM